MKFHANGIVQRYKVWFIAKGFTQTEGLDYMDNFSHAVKLTTIRVLMAISAVHNWLLFQLDVNTSFIHGNIIEEVYIKSPPCLDFPHPNLVWKLQWSLYGLKQASWHWNTKLTDTLKSTWYIQSKVDYYLFTNNSSKGFTFILAYVDDLIYFNATLFQFILLEDNL